MAYGCVCEVLRCGLCVCGYICKRAYGEPVTQTFVYYILLCVILFRKVIQIGAINYIS